MPQVKAAPAIVSRHGASSNDSSSKVVLPPGLPLQASEELLLEAYRLVDRLIAGLPGECGIFLRELEDIVEHVAPFNRLPDGLERDVAREDQVTRVQAREESSLEDGEVRGDVVEPEVDVVSVEVEDRASPADVAELLVELDGHLRELVCRAGFVEAGDQH